MGMKRHALIQTALFMRKATDAFIHHSSASNFSILHSAMLAHQFAQTEHEQVISRALTGKKTEEIVMTLAMQQELAIAELQMAVEEGRAKVIDENYFRRPACSKETVIVDADVESAMDRSH